ncbi:MAG: DUF6531 domain-containing protein, partial [Betaproteobacteria bacterium]|nr:DUF6531 domain-containing protein [Betaproteobacteria bacterium]
MTPHAPRTRPALYRAALGVVFGLTLALSGTAHADCGPSNGDPSPASEACTRSVTESGSGDVASGAGNPIDLRSGNKYRREVDLAALPGEAGLEIVRHYNSLTERIGLLGRGWNLSFELALFVLRDSIQLLQGDGRRIIFACGQDSVCRAQNPADGEVSESPERFEWVLPDGRRFTFRRSQERRLIRGRIEQLQLPGGGGWTWHYGPHNELLAVSDAAGRKLSLLYDARGRLKRIKSPLGEFAYSRDKTGRLVEVSGPQGHARRYFYEDARRTYLLTGIEENQALPDEANPRWQRVATYAYDESGRAILSEGANGAHRVRVAWNMALGQTRDGADGEAVLTNASGAVTRYRFKEIAGLTRLIEARGPGCPTCSPGDVRYAWAAQGQLAAKTVLDAQGNPLRAERFTYDGLGRRMSVTRQIYTAGKPGPIEPVRRFEYAGRAWQPTLIAEPSVVAGQEHRWRLDYDAQGALIGIRETGYTPAVENRAVASTTRVTTLTRDAKGRLTVLDGPLPGSTDSVHYAYDATGQITQVRTPDGRTLAIEKRDAAGFPTRWRVSWGAEQARTETFSAERDARGRLTRLTRRAERGGGNEAIEQTLRYAYDAAGRLITLTGPDGLTERIGYDAAGQPTEQIAPDGSRLRLTRDLDGRIAETQRLDPQGELRQAERFLRNERGELSGIEDALGKVLALAYAPGKLTLENAAGVRTEHELDVEGRLTRRSEAVGTPEAASLRLAYNRDGLPTRLSDALDNVTERAYDDFGQLVLEVSPDRGRRFHAYDVAGREIALRNGNGGTTTFQYDAAGRLIAQGTPEHPGLIRTTWREGLLSETRARTNAPGTPLREVRQNRYDAAGRLTEERLWRVRLNDADADTNYNDSTQAKPDTLGFLWTTRYTYDAAGRRSEEIRPDGHRVRWRYADNGQLAGIDFDGQPVLDALRASRYSGTESWRYGNGIERDLTQDARGRITQITETRRAPGSWWARLFLALTPREFGERQLTRWDAWEHQAFSTQTQTFDAVNNPTAITRGFDAHTQTLHLGYDLRERLTAWHDETRNTRYTLDANSNRVAESSNEGEEKDEGKDQSETGPRLIYRYQPGTNRLLARGEVQQTFRADGVPLTQTHPAWQRQLDYDGDGRLIGVRTQATADAPTQTVRYAIGLNGERIARRAEGHTTYSLYAEQHLTMEADEAGRITRHYIY